MKEFIQRLIGGHPVEKDAFDSNRVAIQWIVMERPRSYKQVQTLDELAEMLHIMGCEHITNVVNEKEIAAARWTIDKQQKFLGVLGKEESTIPRTIVFTKDERRNMHYCIEVNEAGFNTDSNNQVSNSLEWSNDPEQKFSPVLATYYFLFYFAQEPHIPLARTDPFGFQFYTGMKKKHNDIQVTISGVKFKFKPTNKANSTVSGDVSIQRPSV